MHDCRFLGYLCLIGLLIVGGRTRAQNNQFTDRSFVSSPVALGMGDAGVALPGGERGLFYNPAHLPHVASYFTVLGIQGGTSRSFDDHVRFLNQRLNPAIPDEGSPSGDALAALREDAQALQARPARGSGVVLLPNFVYAPGAFAIGGGLFAKTAANYRIEPTGTDRTSVWVLSRTDLMALVSMGLDLRVVGVPGLSVGVIGTRTRRYLAFKNETLDRFEQQEYAVQFQGGTFQVDGGMTYRLDALVSMPGTLRVGGAVYDLLGTDYGYSSGGAARLPFVGAVVDQPSSGAMRATPTETRRAREQFALQPSYRVGVAYEVAQLGVLDDIGIAADYQGYRDGEAAPLSRVHLGVQAAVFDPLVLRAGLSSGYPSGGIGMEWRAVHLDYSIHGAEEGRSFRERRAYVHTARLMVRLE